MKITMTIERVYEMDDAKVEAAFGVVMEENGQSRDAFLRESFYELCGFERDYDHIDGSYVRLMDERHDDAFDFEWPAAFDGTEAGT